jgi:hypothetical protein
MDDKTKKGLFAKLRSPIHFTYISKYVLKMNESETQKILNDLIEEGDIEESPLAKNYFSVTTTKKVV